MSAKDASILIDILNKERNPYVRSAVAFHEDANEDVLMRAIGDTNYMVRLYAIHNPNSTIRVLEAAMAQRPSEHDPQTRRVTEAATALLAARRAEAGITRGQAKSQQFTYKDIDFIETSHGSTYKYLPDGRTQRFKKATSELREPQDAIVFIPNYNTLLRIAPKAELERNRFGENKTQYQQLLLEYAHGKGKTIRILDQKGAELKTNEEIDKTQGQVFLAFIQHSKAGAEDKIDFYIAVSKIPKIGYYTFDTTKYNDKDGVTMRARHIGNEVVRIGLKSGEIIS